MKIVITGSLGNIGKSLTPILTKKGHEVVVITTKVENQRSIEALGAKAVIGSINDVDFLTKTFNGAAIVYLMETWEAVGNLFDQEIDFKSGFHHIANNYKKAVLASGVKKIIHLSSIGAHRSTGFGSLTVHHDVENILKELPDNIAIKFMRPTSFYTNLFRSMNSIKENGVIISNHGGDRKEPWVSPIDIAAKIAEEMELPFEGRKVNYLASDEISPKDIVEIMGKAIGNPNLKWIQISDEEMLESLLSKGINKEIAEGLVEMQASQRSGLLYEDFYENIPQYSTTKFTDFIKEFALVYNQE